MASSRRPTSLMQNEPSGCCSSTFALSPSTADGHASRTAGTNAHGNAALGTAGLKSQGIPAPAAQSRTAAASPPNAFAHTRTRYARNGIERGLPKDEKLRAQRLQHVLVLRLHAHAGRAASRRGGNDFGQRHQALK